MTDLIYIERKRYSKIIEILEQLPSILILFESGWNSSVCDSNVFTGLANSNEWKWPSVMKIVGQPWQASLERVSRDHGHEKISIKIRIKTSRMKNMFFDGLLLSCVPPRYTMTAHLALHFHGFLWGSGCAYGSATVCSSAYLNSLKCCNIALRYLVILAEIGVPC